jgi:ubiquitin carboxyl-terminal hydrolase L5
MIEMQNEAEEDLMATQRRYDSGPVIKKWLEMLAENGFLEENLDRFMQGKAKSEGVKIWDYFATIISVF